MKNLSAIFKAYDIRGTYPYQLDEKTAFLIGEAYARLKKPKKVVVGGDVRLSTPSLKKALVSGLLESGIDVVDIGTITTDQLYFAVGKYGFDGGISVTASHNPGEYNGLKFSEPDGAPIDSAFLKDLEEAVGSKSQKTPATPGKLSSQNILDDYITHQLAHVGVSSIKPAEVVANANFGPVGKVIDRIAKKIGLTVERIDWDENGNFPKGPPNPLLPQNREETIAIIKDKSPDFGVAWDADADRVFFFTGKGEFIPSCYIISLLAKNILQSDPGSKIVHDTTTAWVIDETVKLAGGEPVHSRTGHTFVKSVMRQENAPFGGESSGHYYFRESFYADNGILPLLMILEIISKSGNSLDELIKPLMNKCVVSGEINFTVDDPKKVLQDFEDAFAGKGIVTKVDGLVIESDTWRFSARPSNTEPLFRFNAEARSQTELDVLLKKVTDLITATD